MYRTNEIIEELKCAIKEPFSFQSMAPKSEMPGHLGLNLVIEKRIDLAFSSLKGIKNVVYVVED